MAGGAGQAGAAILQRRHAFLQHRVGGIHDAGIDVAEDLKVEQRRGMIGVFEDEGRGLVDRRGPRAGGGIGLGAGMHGQSVEAIIGHASSPMGGVQSSGHLPRAAPRPRRWNSDSGLCRPGD